MDRRIRYLIRSFDGYAYEAAGTVAAFFADTEQCHACARVLQEFADIPVEVSGSQMAFPADARLPFVPPKAGTRDSEEPGVDREVCEDARGVP
ncbi:MAG: hypothetical protein U1E83_00720 [Methylotetracoccus sp.]